jgi:hypothetical protein
MDEFSCKMVPDMLLPPVAFGGTMLSISDETASESPGFSPGSSVVVSSSPPPKIGLSSSLIAAIATSPIVLLKTLIPPIMSPAVREPFISFCVTLLVLSR